MDCKFYPSHVEGPVELMPSKSIGHRSLICAALSSGTSVISPVVLSNDLYATLSCLSKLGIHSTLEGNVCTIYGGTFSYPKDPLDVCESGSTLRFLIPFSSLFSDRIHFVGGPGIAKRPLSLYEQIYSYDGRKFEKEESDTLSLFVNGRIKPGIYHLDGNISSQFITGLMFILPLLDGDSRIVLDTPLESKGYIDLTLMVCKSFGVTILEANPREYVIPGNQKYMSRNYVIEGDESQAAFYHLANLLGNKINLKGGNPNSKQPDAVFLSLAGKIKREQAPWIDLGNCPDLGPALFCLAATLPKKTVFTHIKRLRYKESDRVGCMKKNLVSLGVTMVDDEDTATILGTEFLKPKQVLESFKDHRIAMGLAVLSTVLKDPIVIHQFDCFKKSDPLFLQNWVKLGGKYEEIEE